AVRYHPRRVDVDDGRRNAVYDGGKRGRQLGGRSRQASILRGGKARRAERRDEDRGREDGGQAPDRGHDAIPEMSQRDIAARPRQLKGSARVRLRRDTAGRKPVRTAAAGRYADPRTLAHRGVRKSKFAHAERRT